jgi:hypothetical protein
VDAPEIKKGVPHTIPKTHRQRLCTQKGPQDSWEAARRRKRGGLDQESQKNKKNIPSDDETKAVGSVAFCNTFARLLRQKTTGELRGGEDPHSQLACLFCGRSAQLG